MAISMFVYEHTCNVIYLEDICSLPTHDTVVLLWHFLLCVTRCWLILASRDTLRSGLEAIRGPEKHSPAAGVCYSLLVTWPSDVVGLKSNMKCFQAEKCHSERTGSGGHMHMQWIHMVNLLPCCLFYKSHPENDLFSQCIATCSLSVLKSPDCL